jgi:hypothetical protein
MARATELEAKVRRMNQPQGNRRLGKATIACPTSRSVQCSDGTITASFYALEGIVNLL